MRQARVMGANRLEGAGALAIGVKITPGNTRVDGDRCGSVPEALTFWRRESSRRRRPKAILRDVRGSEGSQSTNRSSTRSSRLLPRWLLVRPLRRLSDGPVYPGAGEFTIHLPDLHRKKISLHSAQKGSSATLVLWMMGSDSHERNVIGPSSR